jgi:hypothetical protein
VSWLILPSRSVALSGSPPQSNGDQPAIVPLKPQNYRFILDSNGPQQLLRRYRWPASGGIHCVKQRRHPLQNFICHRTHRTHRTQWMVLPNTLFRRQVTEHIGLLMIDSTHTLVLTEYAVELKLLFQHTARAHSSGSCSVNALMATSDGNTHTDALNVVTWSAYYRMRRTLFLPYRS